MPHRHLVIAATVLLVRFSPCHPIEKRNFSYLLMTLFELAENPFEKTVLHFPANDTILFSISIKESTIMKRTIALCGVLAALFLFGACGKIDPADCKHESHDEHAVCTNCGKTLSHSFSDGECTVCGKTTPYLWKSIAKNETLMSAVTAGTAHGGTIERITYETEAYNIEALTGEKKTIEKHAYVYLPYGYSETERYDLLVLLHGSSDSEGYWFAQNEYDSSDLGKYFNIGNHTKDLLDYLIESKQIKPTIVVTPTLYNEYDNYKAENSVVTKQLGKELTNYLLPYMAKNYSTYMSGSTSAEMIAARDHIGYCGFSMGGFTGMESVLSYCLPYFSYIGTFSGSTFDPDAVIHGINGDIEKYPVNYWYSSCGTQDGTVKYADSKKSYESIVKGVPALQEDENTSFVSIANANHTYECSLTSLYNALQVFFR